MRIVVDIDMSVDFIVWHIRSYIASRGWSLTRGAREGGFPHHTTLRGFDTPEWNPTISVLRKLEAIVPPEFTL
jgi:hypothetical protein